LRSLLGCSVSEMEFQPLSQLRTKLNKEVPSGVVDKLNYLWRASTMCLEREPVDVSSSSHRLAQSFIATASQYNVDIPKHVQERFCSYCSVLLVPAVTCQVRLRERSRLSRVNRAKKDRLKNEVVSDVFLFRA
jgi:RNase P subunit RPR2